MHGDVPWYNGLVQLGRPAEKEFTDSLLHALNRCSYTVIALKIKITPEILRELISYNPETGIFTWRERAPHWFLNKASHGRWNTKFAGKRAGSPAVEKSGYVARELCICGRYIREHRAAWLYMTGQTPPRSIDHIDRDATNNKWSNLADGSLNQRNRSMSINNTSGVCGVRWRADRNKWHAQVTLGSGKRHIGYFASLEDAKCAITKFYRENGFSEGHGKALAHYHK